MVYCRPILMRMNCDVITNAQMILYNLCNIITLQLWCYVCLNLGLNNILFISNQNAIVQKSWTILRTLTDLQ